MGRSLGRRVLGAVVLAPLLPALGLLIYYFATQPEPDWVLLTALGLGAAAVAGRLVAAFLADPWE